MKIRVRRQLEDGKAQALARSRDFGWMPFKELKEVGRFLDETTVPAATTLITEGQLNHHFFLLVAGTLDITRGGHHIAFLHAGESCGEMSMNTRGVATATVCTVTPARLLVAGHDQYRALGYRLAGAAAMSAPKPIRTLAPNPA